MDTTEPFSFSDENPNPVLRISAERQVLYANTPARELLAGLKGAHTLQTPEDWHSTIEEAFRRMRPVELESQLAGACFLLTFVPKHDGEYINVYGVNITHRKKMENTLRESDEQFRALIASMTEQVFSIGLDGRFLVFHQGTGIPYDTPLSSDSFFGKRYQDVLPPEAAVKLEQAIESVAEHLNTVRFSYEQRINGESRHFSARVSPLISSELVLTGVTMVVSDVSEAVWGQQRQDRLSKLESLHHQIAVHFLVDDGFDNMLNEVMALVGRSLDVSRVYVFQYQEGQRLLDNTHEWCASGVSAEIDELQGLPYDDLVPSFTPLLISQGIIAPRNITELPEDIRAILAPQGIQTVMIVPIYLHDRLHGFVGMDENRRSRRWLPEEISLLRLVANSLARTLERRETRRELMEAHDAAIQSVRLKSEFMAKMSHELRTPMTGVLGMLELLLETRLDDDQRVFAQDAYHSARTLLVLLDDVLDFSKIEAGRLDLVSEPVDIRAVIDEVRVALLPRLKNRPINFEVSIAPEIPGQLMGDATRLRQVLMNLAGNAVKFTDKGDVLVAVHLLELLQDYARLQFVVQDTGIGIAPEYIDRIFDSFVQADSSITRKYGGSGLGLTISRPLVQLMGSDITVESVPDQGSTFSFVLTLPVLPAAESGDAAHLAGLRILVAGGKDTGRYVLAQQMRLWGADVAEQGDLADLGEALAHVRQASAPVDIVLLHVDRPSSGQAALVQTLRDAAGAKMPCLIAVLDDIPAASGLYGACLQRPVQFADLLSVFDDCLLNAAHGLTIGDAPPPETAAARLLLAEDNPVNRRVILRSLRGMALAIDVAETGQEALALHTARPYDLILMDIRMPEMDGVTATRHIRELPGDAGHVPIVALTASVLKDELQTYQSAGMDAILSKPFEGDSLRQVVARYINKI